jgi:hypothetical protein
MRFQRKILVVAMACALPWMSANAQSAADLKKEIETLKAQLQMLTQKVEAMGAQAGGSELVQQVNRLEQKQELAADEQEKSGFKGLKINGTIEAAFSYDDLGRSHNFSATSGSGLDEMGMIQITKESQDGDGIDWTLRLLPGNTTSIVHEASISIPLNKENRIIGGLIPDFQGYEFVFSNASPLLGNQLISHNALFDLAGPTSYAGIGMAHTFSNGRYGLKWVVGNIDSGNDTDGMNPAVSNQAVKTLGFAARGDWFINEFAYGGLSLAHGSVNRNFDIMAIDGGYTHGDWAFNGQLSSGMQRNAAANGEDAAWTGVSGLVSYRVVPRLQLLARADFISNRKNGGGTYVDNTGSGGYGLGPERLDSIGLFELDDNGLAITGANLTRLTFGTNYQINANTQWKTEYRVDQSSGYNFLDLESGTYKKSKTGFATSLVLSF